MRALGPWLLLLGACAELQLEAVGVLPVVVGSGLAPPRAPMPPAPPQLTPCPAGWRELAEDVTVCEPWPAGGRKACAADEAHFPGEPACTRLGPSCPTGDWAVALPPGRAVVFVRAGAPPGGDGSRAAPFTTLTQALSGGGAGNVIALSRGTHLGAGQLPANTVLFGACVAQTTLTHAATASAVSGTTAPGVELHNLKVSAPTVGVAGVGPNATLLLEDVLLEATQGLAVVAQAGGRVTVRRAAIRGTLPVGGDFGRALHVEAGSALVAERVAVEGNRDLGLYVSGAQASATLTDVSIVDTEARGNGLSGIGAQVQGGARATFTRVVLERNRASGVLVTAGSTAELADVVVRQTRAQASDGLKGEGLTAQEGTLTGRRVRLDRNGRAGALADGAAARLQLVDVVVRDGQGELGFASGLALAAKAGAQLTVERGHFARALGAAVLVLDPGSRLELTDVTVAEGLPGPMGRGGNGISAVLGGSLALTRVRVERARTLGVGATGGGGFTAVDLQIENTLADPMGRAGAGLSLNDGVTATVERLAVHGVLTTGVYVSAASVTLNDVGVRGVGVEPLSRGFGQGLVVSEGAQLTAERVHVEQSHAVGLMASGARTTVEVTQARVDQVALECPAAGCGGAVPSAVAALDGAGLTARDFVFTRTAGIGLQLASGGVADLSRGEVSHHLIGANVIGSFDLSRINHEVVYRDNQTNLASQEVPLPPLPPKPSLPTQ